MAKTSKTLKASVKKAAAEVAKAKEQLEESNVKGPAMDSKLKAKNKRVIAKLNKVVKGEAEPSKGITLTHSFEPGKGKPDTLYSLAALTRILAKRGVSLTDRALRRKLRSVGVKDSKFCDAPKGRFVYRFNEKQLLNLANQIAPVKEAKEKSATK